MATKDCHLVLKNKQQTFDNSSFSKCDNNQYGNLNLNQNEGCQLANPVQSKSILKNDKGKNSEKGFADYNGGALREKSSSGLWKKNDFSKPASNLNFHYEKQKGILNSNNSTLSLHITAYENSIEGQKVEKNSDNSEKKKSNKNWKNVPSVFSNQNANCRNPYEFPRQQKEESTDPEVMQFKASQKVLNPNEKNVKNSEKYGAIELMKLDEEYYPKLQKEYDSIKIEFEHLEQGHMNFESKLETIGQLMKRESHVNRCCEKLMERIDALNIYDDATDENIRNQEVRASLNQKIQEILNLNVQMKLAMEQMKEKVEKERSSKANHRAVQIIEILKDSEFRANKKKLDEIFCKKDIADKPFVALCIAGAARTGKSFIMNFFLSYLYHKEKNSDDPWELDEDTLLNGFEFREGYDSTTMGIWMWNHIFVIKRDDGTEVAVAVIDSQGAFDDDTTLEDYSTIFSMGSMFSSIMCFNVSKDLQADKVDNFARFTEHANKIAENLDGSEKFSQDLVLIIRDCGDGNLLNDENGGPKYIERKFGKTKNVKLQKLRDNLKSTYENIRAELLPHPGDKVAEYKTTDLSEVPLRFKQKVQRMVENLLPQSKLPVKRIGKTFVHCKDMPDYMMKCVKCFNDNKEFAPQAVQTICHDFMMKTEVERAGQKYFTEMSNAIDICIGGYESEKLVALHNENVLKIQNDILKRFKDENIRKELFQKFGEQADIMYGNFKRTNDAVVETEKQRRERIKEIRLHEENLAKIKAESEEKIQKEKMRFAAEQEKLRMKYDKAMDDAAEKTRRQNIDHASEMEYMRDHLLLEIEKQKFVQQKEHYEKLEKIQREKDKEIAEQKAASEKHRENGLHIHLPNPFKFFK